MAVSNQLAGAAALALLALAGWQYEAAQGARQQVEMLRGQLTDKSAAALAAARQSCADRSQRYFRSLGYDESHMKDDVGIMFTDHYSPHLKRCIMSLDSTAIKSSGVFTTKTLLDTDERTSFGEYQAMSTANNGYSDRTITCQLSPPGQAETKCYSATEFDSYVKRMMAS